MAHYSLVSLLVLASAAAVVSGCSGSPDDDEEVSDVAEGALSSSPALAIASVTASADDGNVPANVLDGDLDTRWSAEGDGVWIRFDLGSSRSIAGVRIAFHKGKDRKSTFDLQTSDDAKTWRNVATKLRSSGKSTALQDFTTSGAAGRYLRIVGHGNTENGWTSLTEVSIIGSGSISVDAGPPPPPPPPPSDGSAKVPSDLLDLGSWKITLPVKSGSGPLEVTKLAGYVNSPWFEVDSARNGVRFRANCGGATTSNSGYPRSELREMTASGGLASWSTTSGKHTMTVTEAITATPKVKPHVVAAQIHDAEDDVVMVRLEGNRLFLEGGGEDLGVIDPAYVLGTFFTVTLEATGGHISLAYNGAKKVDVARSSNGCYFKTGVYTQSNTSKGDAASAYGEVVIRSLNVRHE